MMHMRNSLIQRPRMKLQQS